MAEQNKQNQNQAAPQAVFRMQKMYVKDMSFESPRAPQVFQTSQKHDPTIELDLKMKNSVVEKDNYEVSLSISAKMVDKANDKAVLFAVEVEHAAVFLIRGIPQEHMERVLSVDCPFMLFPYTRQIVSQITMDGGFMPLILDPINFAAMFESMKQKQKEDAEKKQKENKKQPEKKA